MDFMEHMKTPLIPNSLTSVLVVVVASFLHLAMCYSDGAPEEVCDTLIPKHLRPPQEGACPYRIELSTYSSSSNPIKYNPIGGNVILNVTITGVQAFKGFIVQARMDEKIVGRFEPSPLHYKMLDCLEGEELKTQSGTKFVLHQVTIEDSQSEGKSTATHVDNDVKDEVVLKWVPPSNVAGQVWFYASVVRNFDVYWVDITSDPLELTLPATGTS